MNAHVSPWGNSINSLGVCTDPAATFEKQFVRFNHKIGYGYSLEGAYFPFRYVGFGCETSMFFNQFELDEDYFRVPANRVQAHYVAFESNKAKTYQFMPGIYFDVPVCSRVLVGGKVLYGMGQTLSFNVEADTHNPALGPEHWVYIYDDFTYGSAFKAGIHGRYLVGRYLEVSAGLNYSYSNAGYAFFKEEELRVIGTQGAEEKEDTGHEEALLSSQPGSQDTGKKGADDAADKGAGGGETVPAVRVVEVCSAFEKRLQAFLRSGNDGRVISKKQPADDRHQNDAEQIGGAAFVLVVCHYLA